ncbi:MAG: alkaline phosphatase family protein [Lachnospiraceae bacterium]|nr:alkaline phosphatase family protein [Lachnospiraceae bacterium]
MSEVNKLPLTHVAATIADLFDVERPALSEEPLLFVEDAVRDLCRKPFDRLFIQNPDCMAQWMINKYPDAMYPVQKLTQIAVPLHSVMPSVTPVNFGTIYTGAMPAVHGITEYRKPVITIDSLFDSMIRAGKKIALLGQKSCSMSNIWLERDMDYFVIENEGERAEKVRDLIIEDKHDVIVVWTGKYDTYDHKYGPEDPHSVAAFYQQGQLFEYFVETIKRNWKNHNALIGFMSDHGCHAVEPTEENKRHLGDHGTDSPLDLNVVHYYGVVTEKE